MCDETPEFHRKWKVYVKENSKDWTKGSFKTITKIENVRDMWNFLNNVPMTITGKSNIFLMEHDLLPLWEENQELFETGGSWSTIVRGVSWKVAMNEIFLGTLGETHFDEDNVRGVCVVPVSPQHSIIKLWVRCSAKSAAKSLEVLLKELNCCSPRFKAFV